MADRRLNIHWTVTRPMLARAGYIGEYVAFWNARPEVDRIWVSLYSPQVDECSVEMLTAEDRRNLLDQLVPLRHRFAKLLINQGIAQALERPPENPDACLFSKMSVNYSADLQTRVEPCVFGGAPDCSPCGCAISSGLHWLKSISVAGPLKVDHLVRGSMAAGSIVNRWQTKAPPPSRWDRGSRVQEQEPALVEISGD